MCDLFLYIVMYVLGFISTLVFLIFFGGKLGINYDPPHPPDYDDYDSNGSAYLAFSLGWFIIVPAMIIIKGGEFLIKTINKLIKLINQNAR
jgi:hypothetical protein